MVKRIILIVLLLALVAGGGTLMMKQMRERQALLDAQQEIQRQMVPLQQEKRTLMDDLQQLQKQYNGKMSEAATIQFVFSQLDERLYLEAFPVMLQYGFTGVLALSGEEYPGAPGRITTRQYEEMLRDGWSICLQWDGHSSLWDTFTDVQWKMPEDEIEMPDTVYLAPGIYSRSLDKTLQEQGIRMLIHHGEEGLPLDITEADTTLWHLGAVTWRPEEARQALTANLDNRGNLVFDIRFAGDDSAYSELGFRDLCYAATTHQTEGSLEVMDLSKIRDAYAYQEGSYRWLRKEEIVQQMAEIQGKIDALDAQLDAISRGDRLPEVTEEESTPLQTLENERMQLRTRMTRYDEEHPYQMVGRATVELVFTELPTGLYSEVFPQLQTRQMKAVLAFSEKNLPGEEGRMTWQQAGDILAHGWESCLIVDGSRPLGEMLKNIQPVFLKEGLEPPKTLYAAQGTFIDALVKEATEAGFTVLIHHGETELELANHPTDNVPWVAGCAEWTQESSASILSPVIEEGLNLAIAVRLGDMAHPYIESGLADLLESTETVIKEGRLVFTGFGEALAYQQESALARERVNAQREEELAAMQAQLDSLDAQIQELTEQRQQSGNSAP